MKKLSKFKLLSFLVAAFLVLNQAVFLFAPINNKAQAQSSDIYFYYPTSDTTTPEPITVRVWVNSSYVGQPVYLHIMGSGLGQIEMAQETGANLYSYYWDINNMEEQSYEMQAYIEDISHNLIAQTEYITVYLDKETSYVNVNIAKPVSGEIVTDTDIVEVTVDSNATIHRAYLQWPGSVQGEKDMYFDTSNLYKYDWNTTQWTNGSYEMYAYVEYGDPIKTESSPGVTVTVSNNITQYLEAQIISPAYDAYVSGLITIEAQTFESGALVDFDIYTDNATLVTSDLQTTSQGTLHSTSWDTTMVANGRYLIKAQANQDGYESGYDESYVYVNNTTTTEEVNSTSGLSINFTDSSNYIISPTVFSAQTNIEVESVSFYLTGPKNYDYPASYGGSNQYYFTWETANFPYGWYQIKVTAQKDNLSVDDYIRVQLGDGVTEKPVSEPLTIGIVELLQSPFFGEQRITAHLNQRVDKVEFTIQGPKSARIVGIKEDDYHYYIIWKTTEHPDGFYNLKIVAWQGANEASFYNSVEIKNNLATEEYQEETWTVSFTEPTITVTDDHVIMPKDEIKYTDFEYISTEPTQPFPDQIYPECREKGITDVNKCQEFMSMPPACRLQGIMTREECDKLMMIPPECREQNLTLEECDEYMRIPFECREKGITNEAECKNFMFTYYMPPECQEAGVKTHEECNQIIFSLNMPLECREAGVTTKEECSVVMSQQAFITFECREAGITDQEECKRYMMEHFMPLECREAGVTTEEECDYLLRNKFSDLSERDRMEMVLPPECLEAEIDNPLECEKYMFEKHAPVDCIEAGIISAEACKKFMLESYVDKENIPVDKLPLECQQAGVSTVEECEQVMKRLYMPQECQDQGITDDAACAFYMEQKYMPSECRDAGAKTRRECDQVMFKKYGPPECLEVGIEDELECEDFMFNRYAPQVVCEGLDPWQCQNFIKDRHLGNIVATQAKFKVLKERIEYRIGETLKVEDLLVLLEEIGEIIPILEKETNLKILAAREKMVLDESDNLVQTGPVALMFDNDGDGLSDDIEERLGTDPWEEDTDEDGYSDGEEVKNNFNPLGSGNLDKIMAPVEQAILENKTLGQPKVEGEVVENFSVEAVANIEKEQKELSQGYMFSGQAESNSIITLYIYSDLPIVTTVQVDEYGNWQYEFKQSLLEGEHEVYVALNDNTGKVLKKSNPLNFFIKEAKAISVEDFVATATVKAPTKSESLINFYLIIAGLIIVVGILLFIIFFLIYKNRQSLRA